MGSGGGGEIGKGTPMRVQELSDWPRGLGGEWPAVRKDSPEEEHRPKPQSRAGSRFPEQGW